MPDTDWMEDARCLDADPDIFFPSVGEPVSHAKEICEDCPVRKQCLEYQLSYEGSDRLAFGVWGGRSPRDRRRIRGLSNP